MTWEPRANAFVPPSAGHRRDPGPGRPPRPATAGDPHPAHLAVLPVRRRGGVVDRRPRRHPFDPTFFRRWFEDAWTLGRLRDRAGLDADVLVRGPRPACRAGPGCRRGSARSTGRGRVGVELIWCMATPADLVLAATLDHVVAVRTSDDYRFAADPALLWTWYLTVNRIAGVLDLPAFKDCFFSRRPPDGADPIDGDEHAELEALLACMSAGPVGIGDRVGCTDPEVVMRTCDDDGRIRHVDRPLALSTAACSASRRAASASRGRRRRRPGTAARGPTSSPSTPRPTGTSSPTRRRWPTSGSPRRARCTTGGAVTSRRCVRSPSSSPPGTGHCGSARRPAERADTGDRRKYVTVESDLP